MRRVTAAFALLALSLAFTLHSGLPAAAAAFDLRAVESCAWSTPGLLSAEVSWSGTSNLAQQQWLDVSDRDNGWAPGTFMSIPLAPNAFSQTLTSLSPNTTYYVEVSQVFADGRWDFSQTSVLRTGSCFFVPARAVPYGSYYGQNPAEGPRTVTSLTIAGGSASSTSTTGGSTTSASGSGSSGAASGGTTNCNASGGSFLQGPLNSGASAASGVAGC